MLRLLVLLPLLCSVCSLSQAQQTSRNDDPLAKLRYELMAYTRNVDAQIGVAIITNQGDTLTLNNDREYPLMSVFKFHQALAVADYLHREQLDLDEEIHVSQEDLKLKTYSPMKGEHPEGGFNISIGELLQYSLQLSDNIACDVLFKYFVSPRQTQHFLQQEKGVQDCKIVYNEAEMQSKYERCYENWTTPYATALLLKDFLQGKIVEEPYASFIREQLNLCQTGAEKLARPLQKTTATIGHKTGGGPQTAEGRWLANNDIGFVQMPNQQQYIIAVFIKDALLSPQESDKIIAGISAFAYDFFKD